MRKKVIKKINHQIFIINGLLFAAFIFYTFSFDIHLFYNNFYIIPLNLFFMYLFNKLQTKFTFPALYDKKIFCSILIKFIFIFCIMFILSFIPYFKFLKFVYFFIFYTPLFIYIFIRFKYYKIFYSYGKTMKILPYMQVDLFLFELFILFILIAFMSVLFFILSYLTGLFTGLVPLYK